jgi:hypothetical protein
VHDRDCTPHLDNKGKGLERQGVTTLATLKTSFPQALAALVAAGGKPSAKPADPATPETKAPGSDAAETKAPGTNVPDSKTGGS